MKLTSRLCVALFFIGNFVLGQEWITTDINEFITIEFPVESELVENNGETAFTAKDDYAFYMVSLKNLADKRNQQLKNEELSNFYQGVINGSLGASNGELIYKKEIEINGVSGIEIEYRTPPHAQIPSQRFKRLVYLNKHLVIIDFWPLASQQDLLNDKMNKFFGSLSVSLDINLENEIEDASNTDDSAYSKGYSIGYFIGQIVGVLFFIGILIGIILLIRYFIRRKKKKNSNNNKSIETLITDTKIICSKCEAENKSSSKYCSHCGYELARNS